MTDSATILAALRKFGIPEWILVDEDWAAFVDFLKENISDANILTDEELVESSRLQSNTNKNVVSIAQRMANIAKEYDGIWSISEDDIAELETQIEIIGKKEEYFDDLIAKTKAVNLDAIEDLTVLKSQNLRLQSEEPTLADRCLKQVEELQEVKLSNERKTFELGQLYAKPAQNPLFMHQMPLNDYFRQLEQFNTNAKHFMQKNFKVQNTEDDLYAGDKDLEEKFSNDKTELLTELGVMADRLLNAYNKLYLTDMNFGAKTSLTNQFKAQNWSPSTLMGMRREMQQMERDIELNEAQKLHLLHKLQEQAVELAQLDVESLINESNQKRTGRAKKRVEYLRRFADIVTETMALSEIFWVLMQLDLQRMKNRNNYDSKLDAYRMESLGSNRRIELMNMLGKLSDESLVQCYCNYFMEILHINLKEYDASINEKIIKSILTVEEFKSSVFKYIEEIDSDINSIFNDHDFFNEVSAIVELFVKFLYDGPVVKPQQFSAWYRKKKTHLERELKMICEENELKKKECSEYIKKWSNDKYWRQKQVLWVWFMTEPKKVIKSLKSISLEAQQHKNAMPAARRHHALAGIVRKT